MKKLMILLMIVVMMLPLTSCLSTISTEQPEVETDTIEEELPVNPKVKAAVFWYDYSDAFLSKVRDALNAELNTLGIEYASYDAAKDQATQNAQVDEAIANEANLLIVNIVDTAAVDVAQQLVDKAEAAEIPIIFFNREVDDTVINSYKNACFVGVRGTEASEMQGTMIGEYIIDNYDNVDLNGDGTISYIMMRGELGSVEYDVPPHIIPVEFCNKVLTEAGKPELVYYDPNNTDKYQPSNWSKTTAFDLMETALSTNPMNSDNAIELVICNNDDAALGCIEALNNAGWNTGDENAPFIPVFGVDYTADAQAAIEAGKMSGSVLQSSTGMAKTIAALVENVMNDKHVFTDAENTFNVDETTAKIRVPYEIKMRQVKN